MVIYLRPCLNLFLTNELLSSSWKLTWKLNFGLSKASKAIFQGLYILKLLSEIILYRLPLFFIGGVKTIFWNLQNPQL